MTEPPKVRGLHGILATMEDVRNLVDYTLMGDREEEDFREQAASGDLTPDEGVNLAELVGLPAGAPAEAIGDVIEQMDDVALYNLAGKFGSTHAYPTAIRIRNALFSPPEIIEEIREGDITLEELVEQTKKDILEQS